MTQFDPLLMERAAAIRMLVLDVDGVLTDGRLYFDSQGNETKVFNTRDGLGIKALQRCDIDIAIITGRSSRMVSERAASLGIEHVFQGSDRKLDAWMELLAKTGLDEDQLAYAGDDWIDLPLLNRAGLAVTVPAADDKVRAASHWITSREGGHGAVRELCDLIIEAQGKTDQVLAEILA